MSAFMVEDVTINRVVTHIAQNEDLPRFGLGNEANLGAAMFNLNIKGVEARYGDGEAKEFRPLDYKFEPAEASDAQVLKSLHCWLYQCSEGDIPETSRLYKLMRDYAEAMGETVNVKSAAYRDAEWG